MENTKRLLRIVAAAITLLFSLTVVSQTAQVVAAAAAFNPMLGQIVFCLLLTLLALLFVMILFEVMRLPRALLPVDKGAPGYNEFLRSLRARLKANRQLHGIALETEADITSAIKVLDAKADAIIKKTAASVFVTTAISQNGKLDGLAVLGAQASMVWRLARIYNQRPTLREMGTLYWNVAGTTFAASEMDEVAIGERIEPIVRTALSNSLLGLIPGVSAAASIVTQSIFEGTANAFLTLRVGIVCRTYCGAVIKLDRKRVRKSAFPAAAVMLGSIAASSAGTVVNAMASAARRAGEATVEAATSGVRDIGVRLNPFKSRSEP